MQFTETNHKCSNIVKSELGASFGGHLVLLHRILSGCRTNRREEEMCTIREPIHPTQFGVVGNTGKSLCAEVQNALAIVWNVFGEIELGSLDL